MPFFRMFFFDLPFVIALYQIALYHHIVALMSREQSQAALQSDFTVVMVALVEMPA